MTTAVATLDGGLRADVATRVVLGRLLDVVRARAPGVLDDRDPEELHQLRVAIRRARSVLARSRRVLGRRAVDRLGRELRWAQQATGALRDLDVLRAELPAHRAALPSPEADALGPLDDWIGARRTEAWTATATALRSRRWRALLRDWADVAGASSRRRPRPPDALLPIVELAPRLVRRQHRRLVRDGRRLDATSPAEALHALRKRGKKLRYVLEAFAEVLDPDAVRRLVKELKALQAVLGSFQDQQVHAVELEQLARAMEAASACPTPTLLAVGALVDRLRVAQVATRAAFDAAFADFDTARVERHVDDLAPST